VGYAIGLGFSPWIRSGGTRAPRELGKITGVIFCRFLTLTQLGSSNQSFLCGVQQFRGAGAWSQPYRGTMCKMFKMLIVSFLKSIYLSLLAGCRQTGHHKGNEFRLGRRRSAQPSRGQPNLLILLSEAKMRRAPQMGIVAEEIIIPGEAASAARAGVAIAGLVTSALVKELTVGQY